MSDMSVPTAAVVMSTSHVRDKEWIQSVMEGTGPPRELGESPDVVNSAVQRGK